MRTKKWLLSVAVLVMLLVIPLVVSADQLLGLDIEAIPNPIPLGLEYIWEGDPPHYAEWYLKHDGTFTDSEGSGGIWQARIATRKLFVLYDSGCEPLYQGKLTSKWRFSGTMACTDSTPMSGTWEAWFPPLDSAVSTDGGFTASGVAE